MNNYYIVEIKDDSEGWFLFEFYHGENAKTNAGNAVEGLRSQGTRVRTLVISSHKQLLESIQISRE